jgi:hypothetical protein
MIGPCCSTIRRSQPARAPPGGARRYGVGCRPESEVGAGPDSARPGAVLVRAGGPVPWSHPGLRGADRGRPWPTRRAARSGRRARRAAAPASTRPRPPQRPASDVDQRGQAARERARDDLVTEGRFRPRVVDPTAVQGQQPAAPDQERDEQRRAGDGEAHSLGVHAITLRASPARRDTPIPRPLDRRRDGSSGGGRRGVALPWRPPARRSPPRRPPGSRRPPPRRSSRPPARRPPATAPAVCGCG